MSGEVEPVGVGVDVDVDRAQGDAGGPGTGRHRAGTAAAAPTRGDHASGSAGARATGWRRRLRSVARIAPVVLVAAVAAAPVVVAALALVGDSWLPMSDWASMVYRVSQVGTRDTPTVGPYSFHGFAHPGPLLYWVTAPLYRLTGGDPRSVLWTGAVVNVLATAGLAAVAWRRGRWPLLLGAMTLVALLVHGVEPVRTVDMWNPHVPLLPFLLTAVLVWDAGLGRRRALLEAAVPASFAVQSHLAFLTLTGLLVVWLVAWTRWRTKLVPAGPAAGRDGGDEPPCGRASEALSWTALVVVLGILWVGPLLDALLDLHNPINVAKAVLTPDDTVGPVDALALVGEHVRPNGLWLAGGDPPVFWVVPPLVNALHLVLLLGLLAGGALVARRRRLVDAVAVCTLSLVLLVGAVPATSQLLSPTYSYLTQWLKVVGGLAWFSVGWTAWRLLEPAVPGAPAPPRAGAATLWRRRRAAGALAAVALVGVTAWTWPEATRNDPPYADSAPDVQAVRAALRRNLPRDRAYRVEVVGDPTSHFTGLIYWMIEDDFDVVTTDGDEGLKWGHAHRWTPGEPYDALLTIGVSTFGTSDTYDRCQDDPGVRQLVAYDALTPGERAWMVEAAWRMMGDPDDLIPAERRRAAALMGRDVRIGVFEGPGLCGV